MADKKTAVFGIYSTRDGVERATDAMVKSGSPPQIFPFCFRKILAA
jgi:hypothetical protein